MWELFSALFWLENALPPPSPEQIRKDRLRKIWNICIAIAIVLGIAGFIAFKYFVEIRIKS